MAFPNSERAGAAEVKVKSRAAVCSFPTQQFVYVRVTDGLSNTLLAGEQSDLAYTDAGQPRRIAAAFVNGWLTGTRALGVPPNYGDWLSPSYNIATVRYSLNERRYNLPGIYEDIGANNPLLSPHAGIVNLLYGEGSVRATSDSLDVQILKSAATRDEGSVTELAQQ
jgi:hypothetical protein